jgi:hypothetical protein
MLRSLVTGRLKGVAGGLVLAALTGPGAHAQGILWPAGQVLPRFADYPSLDVVDISGLSFDRKTAITVLQGLVNREAPGSTCSTRSSPAKARPSGSTG